MRFDKFISQKLGISRNQALELIHNKSILLDGKHQKASFDVRMQGLSDEEILHSKSLKLTLLDEIYVSRAALKLKGFLEDFFLDIRGKKCLDIGSSTGGFVQVLLENGASFVVALDIGSNQLHHSLKTNPKVQSVENTDIKSYKNDEKFELITCDISFTSLKNVLFCIDKLAKRLILLLFKPQFEVGIKAKRDKNGVVKDEKAINKAKIDFEKECLKLGWLLKAVLPSKLKGKEGNSEFFYLYSKAKD